MFVILTFTIQRFNPFLVTGELKVGHRPFAPQLSFGSRFSGKSSAVQDANDWSKSLENAIRVAEIKTAKKFRQQTTRVDNVVLSCYQVHLPAGAFKVVTIDSMALIRDGPPPLSLSNTRSLSFCPTH